MQDRFAGMGTPAGDVSEGSRGPPSFAKKPAVIGVAVVVGLLVIYFVFLGGGGADKVQDEWKDRLAKQARSFKASVQALEAEKAKLQKSLEACISSRGDRDASTPVADPDDCSKQLTSLGNQLTECQVQASSVATCTESLKKCEARVAELDQGKPSETAAVACPPCETCAAATAAAVSSVDPDQLNACQKRVGELEQQVSAATVTVAAAVAPVDTQAKERELLACRTRVETLGVEMKQLTRRLESQTEVKDKLQDVKKTLQQERDSVAGAVEDLASAQKAIEQQDSSALADSLKAVKNDLLSQSDTVKAAVADIRSAQQAIGEKISDARGVVLKMENDVAKPVGSLSQEITKLETEKAKVPAAGEKREAALSAAAMESKRTQQLEKDIEVVENALVSTNVGTQLKAAEKLKDLAAAVGDEKARAVDTKQEAQLVLSEARMQKAAMRREKEVASITGIGLVGTGMANGGKVASNSAGPIAPNTAAIDNPNNNNINKNNVNQPPNSDNNNNNNDNINNINNNNNNFIGSAANNGNTNTNSDAPQQKNPSAIDVPAPTPSTDARPPLDAIQSVTPVSSGPDAVAPTVSNNVVASPLDITNNNGPAAGGANNLASALDRANNALPIGASSNGKSRGVGSIITNPFDGASVGPLGAGDAVFANNWGAPTPVDAGSRVVSVSADSSVAQPSSGSAPGDTQNAAPTGQSVGPSSPLQPSLSPSLWGQDGNLAKSRIRSRERMQENKAKTDILPDSQPGFFGDQFGGERRRRRSERLLADNKLADSRKQLREQNLQFFKETASKLGEESGRRDNERRERRERQSSRRVGQAGEQQQQQRW